VLLAVAGDGVGGREDREDMGVQFLGGAGSEPAGAGKAGPFLVSLTVISQEVRWLENLMEMVGNALISEFRKSAGALDVGHVITFPDRLRVGQRRHGVSMTAHVTLPSNPSGW
jgi:hypothetical protein